MFSGKDSLNHNLAEALNLLNIKEVQLRNEKGEVIDTISPKEHAKALFSYLNMAGYLAEHLLSKAVEYLAAAKPFAREKNVVLTDLKSACDMANRNGQFDADYFITHFAEQTYLTVDDVIDLIVFLQQTAFDRQFGVERDRLQATPWIEEHHLAFKELAKKLGVVTPLPPLEKEYLAAGIMGASTIWTQKRLDYFCNLKVNCNSVWALSGNRELSKGLDEENVMEKVAKYIGKPVNYINKKVGANTREFLDGVTETMMVNYLIQTSCSNKNIGIVDSSIESGHWRATSAQSAADIAPIIINKIQSQEIKSKPDGHYKFLIIAEQPYTGRLAKQVQREFNKEMTRRGIRNFSIEVEGCGAGIAEQELLNIKVLTQLNSDLGALMAERFNDARYVLQQRSIELRSPDIIMFSKRDAAFKSYEASVKQEHQTAIRLSH